MSTVSEKRWLGLCYALTIFVSAFLLFQVQPLISKFILPWFGGTPSVWTTCMLFFQLVLFGGYAYAHITSSRLSPSAQAVTQIVLLVCAIALLPIIPSAAWKPAGDEQPTLRIILLLGASVGVPFFVLSSTGPLLQAWFSRTHSHKSPYRLYALSNVGSLLALVTYPFVFEPSFELPLQAKLWSGAFLLYAAGCATCALAMRKAPAVVAQPVKAETTAAPAGQDAALESAGPPTMMQYMLWFTLPMAASVMLLATTNQVCMDVAAVPFLWVVPLSLYLLSFILCFDSDRWYSPWAFAIAMMGSMATVVKVLEMGTEAPISIQVFVHFSTLFFCAMFCHGELVRLKPAPRYLTSFYLLISAGGAAGGLFVGVVAPYVFNEFLELPIGLLMCLTLMCIVFWRSLFRTFSQSERPSPMEAFGPIILSYAGVALLSGIGVYYYAKTVKDTTNIVSTSRNFYGVLRVKELSTDNEYWNRFSLVHGRILHGVQFVADDKRQKPTTYYVEDSGVGLAIRSRPEDKPKHVGVVGLGAGTVASYANKGDTFRFYDINPRVIELSDHDGQFTYLDDARARGADVDVVLGDARLSLEREEPQKFDVLALDAFSSDAIPVHLLTTEAFEIYKKHLAPDGIIAVHISNRYFQLRPVVEGIADELGMTAADIVHDPSDSDEQDASNSEWVLVSPDPSALGGKLIQEVAREPQSKRLVWTDDRNNLLSVMITPPHVELWNSVKRKWRELTAPKNTENMPTSIN